MGRRLMVMRRAAVLAVALSLAAGCTPSGPGAHPAPLASDSSRSDQTPAASAQPPSLASVLADITPPAGAVRVSADPLATDGGATPQYGSGGAGYLQLDRYWTTTATPYQAVEPLRAHPPAGLPTPPATSAGDPGRPYDGVQLDAIESAELDGPHVFVTAQRMPSGTTALAAHVWETVKPVKPASEIVTGTVSAVDASITVYQSTKPMSSSITGARAQQLGRDLNGLWVDVRPMDAGCGGSIYTSTSFDLTVHAAGGDREFSTGCRTIAAAGQSSAPNLWQSDALVADLQSDFGRLLPAPLQGGGQGPPAPTPPQSATLAAVLDRLTPPAGATTALLPSDIEASATGYSTQPGYEQAALAWTTRMPPDAAIAALSAHVPAGLTGGVAAAGPNKGLPQTSASYRGIDTTTTLGPRLELEAEQDAAGVTTLSALIWQVDKTAKPVRDTVTGTIESVTGTYSGGTGAPLTVTGAPAQQLAFDLNALLVNDSTLPPGCDDSTAALTLTFSTSTGESQFSDSCGFVQVVPALGANPELETSDAFNTDVNQAFGSLVPNALPSSAPLPTSPAGQTSGKPADEVISGYPSGVTLEVVQPARGGGQRDTDQTFRLTGNTALRVVEDLRNTSVYDGPAPAGCQPDMRTTTIRVTSEGRQLTFIANCLSVTTFRPGDPTLTFPAALQKDLDADLTQLAPTRSVDPPRDSTLAVTISLPGTPSHKTGWPLAGMVTVSQDGDLIASKHLAAGQTWHLPVRQGSYTVAITSPGHTCPSEVVTVAAQEQAGPSGTCS